MPTTSVALRAVWVCVWYVLYGTLMVLESATALTPYVTDWRNGSASDSRPEGCGFDTRVCHFLISTLNKYVVMITSSTVLSFHGRVV